LNKVSWSHVWAAGVRNPFNIVDTAIAVLRDVSDSTEHKSKEYEEALTDAINALKKVKKFF
jgi:hypothetical protein